MPKPPSFQLNFRRYWQIASPSADGKAGTIHVLKAAPFGLTAQAIKAVQQWKFKPAQKEDGTPVTAATPVEFTYRLF